MTHDELRDYIDKFDAAGMVNEPVVKALRAVVELHKPRVICNCGDCEAMACQLCQTFEGCLDYYPCPTIQAIMGNLK